MRLRDCRPGWRGPAAEGTRTCHNTSLPADLRPRERLGLRLGLRGRRRGRGRGGRGSQTTRRAHWRHRRRNSGDLRAQAKLLERVGVEFAAGCDTVSFLESFQSGNGRVVPLARRLAGKGSVLCQRLLNFRDAVGRRGLLTFHPARTARFAAGLRRLSGSRRSGGLTSLRGLPDGRLPGAALFGAGLLRDAALRTRDSGERRHAQARRYEQRQGQTCRVSGHPSPFLCLSIAAMTGTRSKRLPVVADRADRLLLRVLAGVRRNHAGEKHRVDTVAIQPAQHLENNVVARLQLRNGFAVFVDVRDGLMIHFNDYVTPAKAKVVAETRRIDVGDEHALLAFHADAASAFRRQGVDVQAKFGRRRFAGLVAQAAGGIGEDARAILHGGGRFLGLMVTDVVEFDLAADGRLRDGIYQVVSGLNGVPIDAGDYVAAL